MHQHKNFANLALGPILFFMTKVQELDPTFYELFEFKPRKGDLKKIEIILAAIDCMATIGYEKTTYEAIAKRIGTRRAHVAYHFKDKADIFEASIKYINASYQQTSIQQMEEANDGLQTLVNYIEAPFIWAEQNPSQLAVMLLFYYLCLIDEKYRTLHADLRQKGAQRIEYILTNKLSTPIDKEVAPEMAKTIQNLMSGTILDLSTTGNMTLKEGRALVKGQVLKMISK